MEMNLQYNAHIRLSGIIWTGRRRISHSTSMTIWTETMKKKRTNWTKKDSCPYLAPRTTNSFTRRAEKQIAYDTPTQKRIIAHVAGQLKQQRVWIKPIITSLVNSVNILRLEGRRSSNRNYANLARTSDAAVRPERIRTISVSFDQQLPLGFIHIESCSRLPGCVFQYLRRLQFATKLMPVFTGEYGH